jgi:hypothetical protein
LPVSVLVHRAVWPSLWPAVPAAAAAIAARALLPGLPAILAGSAAGGLVYVAAFLGWAIEPSERNRYVRIAATTFRRPRLAATV